MTKIPRFRRRDRSGRRREFDRQKLRFWPEPRRRPVRHWISVARPFVLLCALIIVAIPAMDPALVEPVGPLATAPERINAAFTPCGRGRALACVVDGDTFRLGERRIRIIGIDAPEVNGECAEEVRRAAASSARLRELLNAGPFEMVGRIDQRTDRYGRELKALRRPLPDGSALSVAAVMREEGHARRYLGGGRGGWC